MKTLTQEITQRKRKTLISNRSAHLCIGLEARVDLKRQHQFWDYMATLLRPDTLLSSSSLKQVLPTGLTLGDKRAEEGASGTSLPEEKIEIYTMVISEL